MYLYRLTKSVPNALIFTYRMSSCIVVLVHVTLLELDLNKIMMKRKRLSQNLIESNGNMSSSRLVQRSENFSQIHGFSIVSYIKLTIIIIILL